MPQLTVQSHEGTMYVLFVARKSDILHWHFAFHNS